MGDETLVARLAFGGGEPLLVEPPPLLEDHLAVAPHLQMLAGGIRAGDGDRDLRVVPALRVRLDAGPVDLRSGARHLREIVAPRLSRLDGEKRLRSREGWGR